MLLSSLQNSNVNFTSIPLGNVMLKDGAGKPVEAVLSVLRLCDFKDRSALEEIRDVWVDKTSLKRNIDYLLSDVLDREDGSSVYAIELTDKKRLVDRIVGLAKVVKADSNISLSTLVTNPDCSFEYGKERTVRGVGEVLLGAVCKKVSEMRDVALDFMAIDQNFYKKTFRRAAVKDIYSPVNRSDDHFTLSPEACQKYQEYCQRTYKHNYPTMPS